jgi:hypothetical protein
MKTNTFSLFLLLFSSILFGQKDYNARLPLYGFVSELGISPSEEIWVAAGEGDTFYTKQFGQVWNIGPFGSFGTMSSASVQNFERINFFSEDIMMLSGFIMDDDDQNYVYWSGDHGKKWEKIKLGGSGKIDAAYVTTNGKAWMSGSSQLIYYSEDSGRTWKEFDKVEKNNDDLSFSSIHFAKDETTGLFGAMENTLYRTKDNCKTWEKLDTPLSQNKYQKVSKNDRGEISKVRLFGNFYILKQENKVFVSNSVTIDWKELTDVINFEITESDKLYTINRDLTVSLFDSSLSLIWKTEKKLKTFPDAITVKNEKLFSLDSEFASVVNNNNIESSRLFTNQIPIEEPYLKADYNGNKYGFEGEDILQYDKKAGKWFRLMTAGFQISNGCEFNGNLIISDNNLKEHFIVDVKLKTIQKFELPKKLFDTKSNPVNKFEIELGRSGCFHHSTSTIFFKRKDNLFVKTTTKKSSKDFLKEMDKEINENKINQLIDILDQSRFIKPSVADLKITPVDVNEFKKFIDAEEEKSKKSNQEYLIPDYENPYFFDVENQDFGFYKKVADSIFSITDNEIENSFLGQPHIISTSSVWRKISISFRDGKKLSIENNSSHFPNYLHTPWIVEYDNLKFISTSVQLGELVDQITMGQFLEQPMREKKYALFKIADYLYRQKLKN